MPASRGSSSVLRLCEWFIAVRGRLFHSFVHSFSLSTSRSSCSGCSNVLVIKFTSEKLTIRLNQMGVEIIEFYYCLSRWWHLLPSPEIGGGRGVWEINGIINVYSFLCGSHNIVFETLDTLRNPGHLRGPSQVPMTTGDDQNKKKIVCDKTWRKLSPLFPRQNSANPHRASLWYL